jgi:homoserine O-acetyltransferase
VRTDILFPLQQQQEIADGLRAGGADAQFLPLESPQGHDAFLVDIERFGPGVGNFLATLWGGSSPATRRPLLAGQHPPHKNRTAARAHARRAR